MARNRLIKREFFRDEKVGALPPEARLLFQSLWIQADDVGNGRADVRLLRAEAFPFDSFSFEQVEAWLKAIEAQGMIRLYEVAGVRHYSVVKFLVHQSVDRPSKFRFPAPQDECSSSTQRADTEHSEMKGKGKGKGNGKEKGNGEGGASRPSSLFRDLEEAWGSGLVKNAFCEFKDDGDPWLVERNHPVGYFRKHFAKYAKPIVQLKRNDLESTLELKPEEILTESEREELDRVRAKQQKLDAILEKLDAEIEAKKSAS